MYGIRIRYDKNDKFAVEWKQSKKDIWLSLILAFRKTSELIQIELFKYLCGEKKMQSLFYIVKYFPMNREQREFRVILMSLYRNLICISMLRISPYRN